MSAELEKRVETLEKKIDQIECGQRGHVFTDYKRKERANGSVVVEKECLECGYIRRVNLNRLSAEEKAAFLTLGILFEDDF